MSITPAAPEIPRDRYGRPLVTPPGGGKPVAYTRCTSYIDVLDDKYNLQQWMQRMVAIGLANRPDLALAVAAHRDDKRELNRICDAAREAAASSAAATTGTAVHALTELPDRGLPLPDVLPAPARASVDAYVAATAHLKTLHVEQFLVLDTLKIGGTADRIVRDAGDTKIADIKTGSIEWGALKIAMQLAVYARSWMYDTATGERTPSGASTTEGIVIHLPAVTDPADARCDLYAVDLEAGWYAVQVATQVRDKRRLKFADLMRPLGQAPAPAPEPPAWGGVHTTLAATTTAEQIRACTTAEQVRALWTPEWSNELNEIARAHIASLPTVA